MHVAARVLENVMNRWLSCLACAVPIAALTLSAAAHAAYPDKPIKLVQGGKVRALGVTSAKRLSALPNVPTVAESGMPGFEYHSWYGLWGPPGLPAEVVQKLNADVNHWLAQPDVKAQFEKLGYEAQPGTPADFDKFVRDNSARDAKIIKGAGIKAE